MKFKLANTETPEEPTVTWRMEVDNDGDLLILANDDLVMIIYSSTGELRRIGLRYITHGLRMDDYARIRDISY